MFSGIDGQGIGIFVGHVFHKSSYAVGIEDFRHRHVSHSSRRLVWFRMIMVETYYNVLLAFFIDGLLLAG